MQEKTWMEEDEKERNTRFSRPKRCIACLGASRYYRQHMDLKEYFYW
jgi:hypothetical protein